MLANKGAASLTRVPGIRWRILALIFLATAINYIDRQSLSLLFPVMSRQASST